MIRVTALISILKHNSSKLESQKVPEVIKTMKSLKILALIAVLFITVSSIPTEIPPKFCDVDYIDAVLWDGIHYRVTHEQWIADYDENTRTVGDFYHKNKTNSGIGLRTERTIIQDIYNFLNNLFFN